MTADPGPGDPGRVRLCAELSAEWKEPVEELLFFNPQQALLGKKILETIHAFGLPRILSRHGRLNIELGDSTAPGVLFALVGAGEEEHLAGLLLFLRKNAGLLCLHVSVAEDYVSRGPRASLRVAMRLFDELRKIGTRIAGVNHIEVYYKRSGWQRLPLTTRLV
jgi:hypothetical protein